MSNLNNYHYSISKNYGYALLGHSSTWIRYDEYNNVVKNCRDFCDSGNKVLLIRSPYLKKISLEKYKVLIFLPESENSLDLDFIPKTLKILFLPANYTRPLGDSLIDKYLSVVCIENINLLQPNCLPPTIKALYIREQIDSDITQIDPTPYIVNVDTFELQLRIMTRKSLYAVLNQTDMYVRLADNIMIPVHRNILTELKFFCKLFNDELTFDKHENLEVIPFDSFESFEVNKNVFTCFYDNLVKFFYDISCPAQSMFSNLVIVNIDRCGKKCQDTIDQINYFQLLRHLLEPSDFETSTARIFGTSWNQFFWYWAYSSNKSISDYTFIFSKEELFDCQTFLESMIKNKNENDLNLFFGERYTK